MTPVLQAHGRPVVGSGRVPDLVLRLRAAATHLVPFSEARLLLKEAASVIEGLDRERAQRAVAALPDGGTGIAKR